MSFDKGEPLSIDSCAALAAANSISKFEMVLSNVLHSIFYREFAFEDTFSQINYDMSAEGRTIVGHKLYLLNGIMSFINFPNNILRVTLHFFLVQLKGFKSDYKQQR
jgi:hypothetical protein